MLNVQLRLSAVFIQIYDDDYDDDDDSRFTLQVISVNSAPAPSFSAMPARRSAPAHSHILTGKVRQNHLLLGPRSLFTDPLISEGDFDP